MRQIVFRGRTPAKSYKGSRWIFGDLFRTIGTDGVGIQYWDEEDGWMTEDVHDSTVGEYTGFYDNNGQSIFEGDILKSRIKKFEHIPYIVGYRKGIFETRPNNQDLASMPLKYLLNDDDEGTTLKSWTIIGNIHDNPELLKGGEE